MTQRVQNLVQNYLMRTKLCYADRKKLQNLSVQNLDDGANGRTIVSI